MVFHWIENQRRSRLVSGQQVYFGMKVGFEPRLPLIVIPSLQFTFLFFCKIGKIYLFRFIRILQKE